MTSNNARDIGDAVKRRCLHLYLDYPEPERELEILRLKVPQAGGRLISRLVELVQELRRAGLKKPPGISETLDWALALGALGLSELDAAAIRATLPALLKHQGDVGKAALALGVSLK